MSPPPAGGIGVVGGGVEPAGSVGGGSEYGPGGGAVWSAGRSGRVGSVMGREALVDGRFAAGCQSSELS